MGLVVLIWDFGYLDFGGGRAARAARPLKKMTPSATSQLSTCTLFTLPTIRRYSGLRFLNFSNERRKAMSQATVEHILDLIDQLSDRDRELLQSQLSARAEAEWRQEAEEARRQARARGIDQAAIDAAIRKRRYGA